MTEKLLGLLIVTVAFVVPCGMFVGRTVQRAPLPQYAVNASELQITGPITQPVTVTVVLMPVEDNREEAAQVIWRVTFALALALILLFLATAVLIRLSFR